MESKLCRYIRSAMFVWCVFLVSACATTKPGVTVNDKTGAIARETTQKTASKAEAGITKTSNQIESAKPGEQNKTAAQIGADKSGNQQNINTRISLKEKRVQIKSMASNKARTIARLQGGKQIEIMEEKGIWLKIRWQDGDKTKKGWLRTRYVEMTP